MPPTSASDSTELAEVSVEPVWPGQWEPAGRAWSWAAGWRWVPGPGALELAQRLAQREEAVQERRQRQVRV